MKNKNTKTKNYYSTNHEKLQERLREYYRNLSEDEEIKNKKKQNKILKKKKKRKYAKNIKKKNNSDVIREI